MKTKQMHSRTGKNIYVIIPAFNEKRSIRHVVKGVLSIHGVSECVVVDDCSSDSTAFEAKKAGAHIITKQENNGAGSAIITGLSYVSMKNYDYVVFMDADGQHDPIEIHQLVKELRHGADYVIASRYIGSSLSVTSQIRKFGTLCISWWIYLWYGRRIYDPTSGYRAVSKKALQYLINHYPTRFSEPEILLDILKKDFVIKEIPSQMKQRMFGKSSISFYKAVNLMMYLVFETARKRLITSLHFIYS